MAAPLPAPVDVYATLRHRDTEGETQRHRGDTEGEAQRHRGDTEGETQRHRDTERARWTDGDTGKQRQISLVGEGTGKFSNSSAVMYLIIIQ